MTLKAFVLPGVRAFTSSMRVKLFNAPSAKSAMHAPFSLPVQGLKPENQQVHWRVSPATGELEQRRYSIDRLTSRR